MFDLRQSHFFGRPVRGADGIGALESDVLEHVSQTGLAFWVIDRAYVDKGVERNDGGVMAFEDDEVQTVRESKFGDALFEGLEILCGEGAGERKEKGGYPD